MTPVFDHVAVIGLGLMGSSLYRAIKRGNVAQSVVGYAPSQTTRDTARRIGLCDEIAESAPEAVEDADLVVLASPLSTMGDITQTIASRLKQGATLIDVGSAKTKVIETITQYLPTHVQYVPCHPMAGTEHSGPEAGFAELYDGRWCLIVPLPETDLAAIEKVEVFWDRIGAVPERIDAQHHDTVCAVVSHVPHLIAYTMVGVADDLNRLSNDEVIKYSAGGFRDFTRIAASDPTMWRDIFLQNKQTTLDILGRFTEELFALQRAIRLEDGAHLHAYFSRTRDIRRGILDAGRDVPSAKGQARPD